MSRLLLLCIGIINLSYFAQVSLAECTKAKDFQCDFEGECDCWRQGQNGLEDDIDWSVGTKVATFGWSSIPRARTETNSTFAFAARDSNNLLKLIPKGAMLISKVIPCVDRPLTMKMWYWKAAFIPQIRVCYKYFDETKVAQCSVEVNGYQPPDWLPLNATFPSINRPFQIVIQAIRLFPFQSVVAIDDIMLDGDLTCNSQNPNPNPNPSATTGRPRVTSGADKGTKGVTTATGAAKTNTCSDVKLSDTWSGDFNRGVWQPCENGTSCKQATGVGAATGWDVLGEGTFVLESQDFKLDKESLLKFQYQFVEKNFTSKLRLCIDALDACPFVIRGSAQDEKWSRVSIPLTGGWHKIFFTVTNMKNSDHVKVRRINVRTKEESDGDSKSSGCALLMTLVQE